VADRGDAGRLVNVQPRQANVSFIRGLAGVHADAHLHLLALGPRMRAELPLYVHGRGDAGSWRRRDGEETSPAVLTSRPS
jgi:hypothetical protein